MKHLVSFPAIVLLGSIAVVACSGGSDGNGTAPPEGTNDAGSSGSSTTDGSASTDAPPPPPDRNYDTWRVIQNPTAKEDAITAIAANDTMVFVSGREGGEGGEGGKEFLESRSIASGLVQWRVEMPAAAVLAATSAFVAIGAGNKITVLKAANGAFAWDKPTSNPIRVMTIESGRLIAGGTTFAAYPSNASTWRVVAFAITDGKPLWYDPITVSSSYGDYIAGVAATADAVFFSYTSGDGPYTRDWYVTKRPLVDGQPQSTGGWARRQTQGSFNGASLLVANADRVYAVGTVSDVKQVVALNAADGEEIWRKSPPAELPFTPGYGFELIPFLDPNGVMLFAWETATHRSASYLLGAADGATSRVVEHFVGATMAAVSSTHLFVAGTTTPNDAGTDTQWQIDNVQYADGQFSATRHIELK